MSLRYALLVALSDGPKTGYDVARYFDETVGFFWRATQSQIYRDLGKLRERSQVTSDVIEQSGKPNKVVFTITDEGRRTLLEWSRAPSDPPVMKDNFLVQLYGVESVDLDALREHLSLRMEGHRDRQRSYEEKHASIGQPSSLADVGRLLALEVGIRSEREWADWCERALDALSVDAVAKYKKIVSIGEVQNAGSSGEGS